MTRWPRSVILALTLAGCSPTPIQVGPSVQASFGRGLTQLVLEADHGRAYRLGGRDTPATFGMVGHEPIMQEGPILTLDQLDRLKRAVLTSGQYSNPKRWAPYVMSSVGFRLTHGEEVVWVLADSHVDYIVMRNSWESRVRCCLQGSDLRGLASELFPDERFE